MARPTTWRDREYARFAGSAAGNELMRATHAHDAHRNDAPTWKIEEEPGCILATCDRCRFTVESRYRHHEANSEG